MNGLQITGMKLSSPAPTKKTVLPPQKVTQKPKTFSKAPVKKMSVQASGPKKSSALIEKKVEKKVEPKPKEVE